MFTIEEIDEIMRKIIRGNDVNVANGILSLKNSIIIYSAYKTLLSNLYLQLHERENTE